MKTTQLREAFKEVFGVEADHTFFSPGRINLIGEHTTTTVVTSFQQPLP